MIIKAHLNGGPNDDAYMVVDSTVIYVAGWRRASLTVPDSTSGPVVLDYRNGSYRMRRDAYDQPVPHNLAGVIEYDWAGWWE